MKMCAVCGSRRIQRRVVPAEIEGGRTVDVEADVCPDCGEEYYDLHAMQAIDSAREGRARDRRSKPLGGA
jgi:YgiT-type zinc finger domain-containing protein